MRDLDLYRSLDPDQVVLKLPIQSLLRKDEESGEVKMSSLALNDITNGDIVRILEKIQYLVMNNSDGMGYQLERVFGDRESSRYRGPSPGTLRIFGTNRACFFTGQSWRRIKLTRKEN